MKKRNILTKIPPSRNVEVPVTPVEIKEADLNEENVFGLPQSKKSVEIREKTQKVSETPVEPEEEIRIEITDPVPPPSIPVRGKQYSHLEKARAASVIARKRLKEERAEIDKEVREYKEKLKFEKLQKKHASKSKRKTEPELQPQPEPTPIPEEPSYQLPQADLNPHPQAPPNPNDSYRAKGSSQYEVDYDRIINGVRDSFMRNQEYTSQLEQDIRNDERKRADVHYKKQMEEWETKKRQQQTQQEKVFNVLSAGTSRRNNVFDRTKSLQQKYTDRYKSGWYNY